MFGQSFVAESDHKEKEIIVMVAGIIVCLLVLCCCFTHRRVIKALIKHEEMPKAPKWHCWVKKENRRE